MDSLFSQFNSDLGHSPTHYNTLTMNIAPSESNKLKVNRPINRIPGAQQRPTQEPRGGNSLRVIPILLPQSKQLTQQQLGPAKQRNPISKTSAPVNTQSKSSKPKRNLKKEKEAAIEWLNNLPDLT